MEAELEVQGGLLALIVLSGFWRALAFRWRRIAFALLVITVQTKESDRSQLSHLIIEIKMLVVAVDSNLL